MLNYWRSSNCIALISIQFIWVMEGTRAHIVMYLCTSCMSIPPTTVCRTLYIFCKLRLRSFVPEKSTLTAYLPVHVHPQRRINRVNRKRLGTYQWRTGLVSLLPASSSTMTSRCPIVCAILPLLWVEFLPGHYILHLFFSMHRLFAYLRSCPMPYSRWSHGTSRPMCGSSRPWRVKANRGTPPALSFLSLSRFSFSNQ